MTFSDDASLLLDCSRIRPDELAVERMRGKIAAGVNWGELLRLAIPHGLLPLLAQNLTACAADIVPAMTLAQLAAYRRGVEKRNQQQTVELSRMVELLSNSGVRALSFKGPLLALLEYENLSLRESHDIDLWVHPRDLTAAGKILRSQGYLGVGHRKGVPYILDQDRGELQTEFISLNGEVLIELHEELQSRQFSFLPDFDEVWQRRREIPLNGAKVSVFAPEDMLLTLAVHGSKHMWRRLNWVVDIVALIDAHPNLNWETALARARRWHCKRRLLSAAQLAENLYRLKLPCILRRECRGHSYTRRSVARVQNQIIDGMDARTIANFISELQNHTQNGDTIFDRMHIAFSYLKKLLHVDEAEMLRSMPRNTLMFIRMSKGLRGFLGKLVSQD